MAQTPISDERFSEQFDCVPSTDELDLSDERLKLAEDWSKLGNYLRQFPIASASIDQDVRREIERHQATAVVAQRKAIESPRRRSGIAVLVSSITVLVCLASLMYFPAPLPDFAFRQSLVAGFTSNELADGFSNCDVVMITMPDGPEETTDFLQASLANRGVEARAIAVASKPQAVSQLMGSNADSGEIFSALTAMNDLAGNEQADEFSREDILAKLLESLETPSLAEENFNDYVVVLPKDVIDDMRNNGSMLADVQASPGTEMKTAKVRKLVFVVRRKKISAAGGNDRNGASLESPAASTGEPV